MSDEHKPTRVRSPSYPYVDLETAIEKIKTMDNFTKRTPVLVKTMLPRWGFESGKSAHGMKLVAALKSYGLIGDSGKKENRKIQITDDAFRIINTLPNSDEHKRLIKECALKPEMYKYMWDNYGDEASMPHDDAIKSHLVIEKRFNSGAVKGFLDDYKQTIRYAGLVKAGTIDDNGEEDETPPEVKVGDTIQWTSLGVDQFPTPLKVRAINETGEWLFVEGHETGIPIDEVEIVEKALNESNGKGGQPPSLPLPNGGSLGKNMKQDTFNLPGDGGAVVINWPSSISQDAFEDFTDWLILQHRKISRDVEGDKKPKLERREDKTI